MHVAGSWADRYLRGVADSLQERGYHVSWERRTGPVGEQIALAAQEQPIDLIAMSTHGRSGFGRFVMGSVAERVLKVASVPLLLIRPDQESLEQAQLLAQSVPGEPLKSV